MTNRTELENKIKELKELEAMAPELDTEIESLRLKP